MKRNITISILYSIIIIIFYNQILYSRIYKRIKKDGTIEFYNRPHSKSGNFKKRNFKSKYNTLIESIAKREKIDPYLIKCIIKVESNFKASAVSVAGAMGLMQLMQGTAEMYKVKDPLDPKENLNAGIRHFKYLLKALKNDIPLALAAYHAGLGRVKRKMKIPPIRTTINYVNRIMLLYNGKNKFSKKIKKLYKKLQKDGTLVIYSR